MIKWNLEKRKLADLKPYDKNPRVITKAGIDLMKNSIDEIGLAQPININTDNTILSGHARYYSLLESEGKNIEIDVYVPHRELTKKEIDAVVIRMNKNVAGLWDYDILGNEYDIEDLLDYGFDPLELGAPQTNDEQPKDEQKKESEKCPMCGK